MSSQESFLALSNLQLVDLSRNNLTGSVPEFGDYSFTELEVLDISSNGFTGYFPCSLTSLSLAELRMGNNSMSGGVPIASDVLAWSRFSDFVFEWEGGSFEGASAAACGEAASDLVNKTMLVNFDVEFPDKDPSDIWNIAASYLLVLSDATGESPSRLHPPLVTMCHGVILEGQHGNAERRSSSTKLCRLGVFDFFGLSSSVKGP